jgi:outer membrane biosynthesis protein TonB
LPAHVGIECFKPGPEDYAVTIVVRDTMYRDTLWLRPLLDGVGGAWKVELPLPHRSVDVAATIARDGTAHDVRLVRRSGVRDFDERALLAVDSALADNDRPLPARYAPDSLRLLVRFGAPDTYNALVQTWLSVVRPPKPKRGNPEPDYPAEKRAGQRVIAVVLVDSLGEVDPDSIEIALSTDDDYARAVMDVLPRWRFTPSMIRGCRVSRLLRLDFGDKSPD